MDHPQIDRINQAVRDCLALCIQAEDPVATIRAFLVVLRAEGWTEKDAGQVRATLSQFLRQVCQELDELPG